MSMITQLIAAVSATERQIDEQIMKLSGFNSQIDRALQQVSETLSGSTKSYDSKMNSGLSVAQAQLESTIAQLSSAKTALQQVRMV